ncbi:MAG: MFS transporter [Opitutales bacterium]|nr:MFS transporter [Opitutales bacterium]
MKHEIPQNIRPVTQTERIGYGMGDAASNFFFHTFNIFLLAYYVDVFGLTAAAVGTMFLVTKLLDAFTDIFMGMLADRTKTRWGKFRPYILYVAIPYGVIGYAMFANPELNEGGKLVYAYVTYSLMMLAYTAINVPYSSLLGVISPSSAERSTLASYRFVMAFGAQAVISAFVLPFKNILGQGDEALGYQLTMAIFATLSIAMWLFTFASTKERVKPDPKQKTDLKGDLKILLKNGPWIALVFCGLFTLLNLGIRGGATMFYMKYYAAVDDAPLFWIFDKTSVFFMSGTIAMLIGSLLSKPLTKFFSKKLLMLSLTGMQGVIFVIFYFIPPDQFWTMMVVNFIATLVIGPTPAIVWAMYADCADYGEWKYGRRTTGLIFSGIIFSQKTGVAVGAGLAGWILGWFGFVANVEQTETALFGIRLMFSIIPGIFLLFAAISVIFYGITNPVIKEMEKDLSERRK